MAIIQSGATSTLWTIDTTSTAGRMTLYDQYGNAMSDISSLSNILNALNSNVTIVLGGQATIGIDVESTSGTLTLSFEATINDVNWFAISATPVAGGSTITSTTANGQWVASTSGYYAVRARVSSFTSGSMTVSAVVTPGQSKTGAQAITSAGALSVEITDGSADGPAAVKNASTAAIATDPSLVVALSPNSPLPTGSNAIGTVTANAGTGTFAVSGTVAATQSGTWTNTVTQATASNLRTQTSAESATAAAPPANAVYVGGLVTTAVESGLTNNDMYALSMTTAGLLRVDGSNITQPVSGTVTANAGTGSFTVVQGTAANLNATVTGTVAATQSGTWTVQPGNTANTTPWLSTINQGGNSATVTASNALKVDGSAVTQPVSGTVTANAGTGTFAVSGTVTANQGAAPWADNITQFGGVAVSTGTGASGTGIPRVTVSNDSNILATQSGTWTNTVTQATAANLNVTDTQGPAAALSDAWSMKITDATNGPAAVKAASTAAIATDPALVVAISPNNSLITSISDTTATGTLGALNATTQITLAGAGSAGFQLAAGTLVGTILAEVSFDAGTSWNSTYIDQTSGNIVSSIVFASSNGAAAGTFIGVGGTGLARVRVSAYTSGTANITLRAAQVKDPSALSNGNPSSTVQPIDALQIGGWDNATTTFRVPAVKAASTQSALTDQAMVVALSPGSAQTRASTTTVAGVTSSATSVTILAANSARLGAIITNSSTSILYLRYSATAAAVSSGNYTVSVAVTLGTHEVYAGYTGTITGIWATANGFCNVTEISV
jgi:hypothetical protein